MNLSVTQRSDVPIYMQLKNRIIEAVLKGELKPGTRMPSVRSLSRELGIAIITVRRAYDDLVTEGFLSNIPAVGYDVCDVDITVFKEHVIQTIKAKMDDIRKDARACGIDDETLMTLWTDKGDKTS